MPWLHQTPPMPAANFTGVYRRRFTVTATWTGKRIVAPFGIPWSDTCFIWD